MDKQIAGNVMKCPYKPFVELALSLVNLTDKEKTAINLVDVRGISEERASEMMDLATRTVQRSRQTAYKKICQVWQGNKIIEYMADTTTSE